MHRPTWAEIDLAALRANVDQVRRRIPSGTQILAQVKSDAYGHGMVPVAREFAACGVDMLGVASLDEAQMLRAAGIRLPVLVQSVLAPADADAVLEAGVTPTVCTADFAQALDRAARSRHTVVGVHLKIDTGMGRLGVWHEEAEPFLKQLLASCEALRWQGCYTHLPSADDDPQFTRDQLALFVACVMQLRRRAALPLAHAANSLGVIGFQESHLNVVRPGLMLYGLYPLESLRPTLTLQPVLRWVTRVIFLKQIPAGRTISYGRTYVAQQPTTIATVPVGYGDGFRRLLSNRAAALVRGARVPVAGRVCMDHLMLDVGQVPDVRVGDEVVLIGEQGAARVTAEDHARWAETIPYEIVTGLTDRIPRRYLHGSAESASPVPSISTAVPSLTHHAKPV